MKKAVAAGLAGIMLAAPVAVFAEIDSVVQNRDTQIITVNGTVQNPYEAVTVGIADDTGTVMDFEVVHADAAGVFQYQSKITSETDDYVAVAKGIDGTEYKPVQFRFFSKADIDGAMAVYNEGRNNPNAMETFMNQYLEVAGLDSGLFNRLTDKTMLYAKLAAEPKAAVPSDILNAYNKNILVCLFNQAKAGSILPLAKEFQKELALTDETLFQFAQTESFGAKAQNKLEAVLEKETFTAAEDIKNSLIRNVFLCGIECAPYYTVTRDLVENYTETTGLILSAYNGLTGARKDAVMKALTGYAATSYAQVQTRLDSLIYSSGTSTAPGGGGGGTRGNGGNALPPIGNTVDIENIPESIVEPVKTAFVDLEDVSWAREAIEGLTKDGAISGKEPHFFKPFDNITRAEFVKILTAAFGIKGGTKELAFADVAADNWAYPYIQAAVENGIVSGLSADYFGAGEHITRQDMAVMVYRVLHKHGQDGTVQNINFTDWQDVATYAQDSVAAMSGMKIINGVGDGRFAPKDNATRAQAAKMIYDAKNILKNAE